MNPLTQLKNTTILPVLIALTLACFGLSPQARAVCQEGCLTNQNTVLGNDALLNNTGFFNTATGFGALSSNTTGFLNTATGADALLNNTTGINNTATGSAALQGNTTGGGNTANGADALLNNTTGSLNTATGINALENNLINNNNTATGANALSSNAGDNNTATGSAALSSNEKGDNNTATGANALSVNEGDNNTATGVMALFNTTGGNNTATGFQALLFNTTGADNTANGVGALANNTTGSQNTAAGVGALTFNTTGGNNTAIGFEALIANRTGNFNIALGFHAAGERRHGDYNIDIGAGVGFDESNTIRIGTGAKHRQTFIAGISGSVVPDGVGVIVGTDGKLGTIVSSERFKDAIKPMDKASEAILSLQPVTFRYKKELDPEGIPQFGLVAEDVEKVNPALVARDAAGKLYTVRYEAVNAMLLNEFLKEHRAVQEQNRKIQEQEATIAQLKEDFRVTVARLSARLEEQASQIQKVSAQVEMSRPAPQRVVDNH